MTEDEIVNKVLLEKYNILKNNNRIYMSDFIIRFQEIKTNCAYDITSAEYVRIYNLFLKIPIFNESIVSYHATKYSMNKYYRKMKIKMLFDE